MRSSPMDAKGDGGMKTEGDSYSSCRSLPLARHHLDASNCAGDREMLSETVVIA